MTACEMELACGLLHKQPVTTATSKAVVRVTTKHTLSGSGRRDLNIKQLHRQDASRKHTHVAHTHNHIQYIHTTVVYAALSSVPLHMAPS